MTAVIVNYQKLHILHNSNSIQKQARAAISDAGADPDQLEADFKRYFGITKVVFVEGVLQGDLTKGHIDDIARFINPTTVVVPECTAASRCRPNDGRDAAVYDTAAATIEAAGLTVIRDPIEGVADFMGDTFDTNYINWIVGNGFVIVVGFNNPTTDTAAKSRKLFPGETYMSSRCWLLVRRWRCALPHQRPTGLDDYKLRPRARRGQLRYFLGAPVSTVTPRGSNGS